MSFDKEQNTPGDITVTGLTITPTADTITVTFTGGTMPAATRAEKKADNVKMFLYDVTNAQTLINKIYPFADLSAAIDVDVETETTYAVRLQPINVYEGNWSNVMYANDASTQVSDGDLTVTWAVDGSTVTLTVGNAKVGVGEKVEYGIYLRSMDGTTVVISEDILGVGVDTTGPLLTGENHSELRGKQSYTRARIIHNDDSKTLWMENRQIVE